MPTTPNNIVLYINDHPDISTVLNFACSNIGILVEFVEQPEVGLAAMKGMRPAALVVDVFMPRLLVDDFVREARTLQPDVLVFLISAVPDIETHAKRLNVLAYLTKPFSVDRFVEMCARSARNAWAAKQCEPMNSKLEAVLVSSKPALSVRPRNTCTWGLTFF